MTTDAFDVALALAHSLDRLRELEQEQKNYDYELPPALVDDIETECLAIHRAVRLLADTRPET